MLQTYAEETDTVYIDFLVYQQCAEILFADLITSLSLASAGYPQMAFSGCYAGPLFSILSLTP
jgi:hypothetical protein